MFSWRESKREETIEKHKVDFALILDIFSDPFSIDYEDYEHSTENEIRYGVIAKTARYALVELIYTVLEDETFHFITARRAET